MDRDILSQVPVADIAPVTAAKKRGFRAPPGGLCEIAAGRVAQTGLKTEHTHDSSRRGLPLLYWMCARMPSSSSRLL